MTLIRRSDLPAHIIGLIPPPSDDFTGSCPCGCGVQFIDGVQQLPPEATMFHLRDGYYFMRHDDGRVTIRVCDSALADAEVLGEVTIPDNEWASVVASTAARGETGETYNEALDYLRRES